MIRLLPKRGDVCKTEYGIGIITGIMSEDYLVITRQGTVAVKDVACLYEKDELINAIKELIEEP